MVSERKDLKANLLRLFAVIDSPILVFSIKKELMYSLWPHRLEFGQTIDLCKQGLKTTKAHNHSLLEPKEDLNTTIEASIKLNGQSIFEQNLNHHQESFDILSDKSKAYTNQDSRSSIVNQAQKLILSWPRSIGEPLLINENNPLGCIMLASGLYVVLGPILPLRIKLGSSSVLVDNLTARMAANMWLNICKEQSRALEHSLPEQKEQQESLIQTPLNPISTDLAHTTQLLNNKLVFGTVDLSLINAATNSECNPFNGDGIKEAFDIEIDATSLNNIWSVRIHNLYRNEVLTQEAIREGDVEKLKWAYQLPNKGKIGILGPTPLRSWKNHAHLHNVLASRAAIDAGVTPEEAYTLSDKLFLAVETISDPALAKHMRYVIARAFAELVHQHHVALDESIFEPPLVRKTRFLIQKSLTAKITLSGLAGKLGCSEQHLCRIFKSTHKQSIMQYVVQQRINLAKDLLRESDNAIGDIAALLQFTSCSHFCRVFKQHTQLSPAKWRLQHAFTLEHTN